MVAHILGVAGNVGLAVAGGSFDDCQRVAFGNGDFRTFDVHHCVGSPARRFGIERREILVAALAGIGANLAQTGRQRGAVVGAALVVAAVPDFWLRNEVADWGTGWPVVFIRRDSCIRYWRLMTMVLSV